MQEQRMEKEFYILSRMKQKSLLASFLKFRKSKKKKKKSKKGTNNDQLLEK